MRTVEEYAQAARDEVARQLSSAERAWKKENPDKNRDKTFPPSMGLDTMLRAGQVAIILAVLEDVQQVDASVLSATIQDYIENLD